MTDLFIVGLGLRNVDHVTAEAERALRSCNEVLFLDMGPGTLGFLQSCCSRVTSVAERYGEGGNRLDAYRAMAVDVLEAALDHPPVAWATYGHPTVFAYPPFLMRDMARELGLQCTVIPGISAMESLLAALWLDPTVGGLQMFEATDLLLRHRRLDPEIPALIWQVGNLESRLHTSRFSRPERFARFTRFLLARYPADHPVTALYGSPHPLVPTVKRTFPLADLPSRARELHVGVTLYVPPR